MQPPPSLLSGTGFHAAAAAGVGDTVRTLFPELDHCCCFFEWFVVCFLSVFSETDFMPRVLRAFIMGALGDLCVVHICQHSNLLYSYST